MFGYGRPVDGRCQHATDGASLDARGRLRYGVHLMSRRRSARLAIALTAVVVVAISLAGMVMAGPAEHQVVGRWVVQGEPGGAVWAFQPSGALIASGPGDIQSAGSWESAEDEGAFDATLEVTVTGQTLHVLGQVAEDGSGVALYVSATEAASPEDWTPWPAESRLLATPFGMMAEDTPAPSEPPLDCLRPTWVDGAVDWDRCDEGLTPA